MPSAHFTRICSISYHRMSSNYKKKKRTGGKKRKVKETVGLLVEEDGKMVIDNRKSVGELLNSLMLCIRLCAKRNSSIICQKLHMGTEEKYRSKEARKGERMTSFFD